MYGKSYETKYEGSMVGAGFHVYAVWDYCIAKNRSGHIELNPKLVAYVLAGGGEEAEEAVKEAIEYLSGADARSRSKDEEGRRLVKEGEYQYRMVNWAAYDAIRSIADLREYNRRKQAEYRARKKETGEVVLTGKDAEAYENGRAKGWRRRRKVASEAGEKNGARAAIEAGLAEAGGKKAG